MAKYLLGQCFMWTILGNTISLVDFRRFRASTLNRTLWLYLWYNPKNDILEFGAYWWSICSGSVLCGQLLGNTITLTDFRTVGASTLNRTLWIFLWNISKNNILEFGAYWWSICSGSVLCGQLLGNTITLTDFRTVGASTLNRTLWIFLWNISKNNILEFGAYWWSICSGSGMWTTFGKRKYFGRFSNSWCKHFEQNATKLSVEHFKEQHTGIWYLLAKYLRGQCYLDKIS